MVLAAGMSGTEGIIHTGLGPLDIQRGSTLKYGRLTYTRDRTKLQIFVNALDAESPALLLSGLDGQPLALTFENQAYDVELSDSRVHERHILSYGGNYRHNSFNISMAPRGDSRDEGGAYVQEEIFLARRARWGVRWVVGTRVDVFDVLDKAVLSPRTALLLKPRPTRRSGSRSTARFERHPSSTVISTPLFSRGSISLRAGSSAFRASPPETSTSRKRTSPRTKWVTSASLKA